MAKKAVFFDRDDTLIDDPGYIQRPDQVRLLPGVPEALIQLKKMGYLLIVITNQSGIARGLLTEEGLEEIHHKLKRLLQAEGAAIDDLYYCPYHPEGVVKNFSMESNLRKPGAGMFFEAEQDHDIDLSASWIIGDSYRDIAAGRAAGCHTILVDVPGKIREKKQDDPEPDRKAVNLREAVNIIRMYEFHVKARSARNDTPEAAESEPEDDSENEGTPVLEEPDEAKNEIESETASESVTSETPAGPEQSNVAAQPESTEPEASAEEQTNEDHGLKPAKVYTVKDLPKPDAMSETDPQTQTHHLLEELLHRLRSRDREGLYQEFSVCKLLSLMIQVIAVFCLIVSLFFWLNPKVGNEPVLIMIGYAVVLQLIVIALQLMHSND